MLFWYYYNLLLSKCYSRSNYLVQLAVFIYYASVETDVLTSMSVMFHKVQKLLNYDHIRLCTPHKCRSKLGGTFCIMRPTDQGCLVTTISKHLTLFRIQNWYVDFMNTFWFTRHWKWNTYLWPNLCSVPVVYIAPVMLERWFSNYMPQIWFEMFCKKLNIWLNMTL